MLVDQLDLDKSLQDGLELESRKREKTLELESKISRLGMEIRVARSELERLQARLTKMNDEGSGLEEVHSSYQLLSEEFKLKSEALTRAKLENENLKTEHRGLCETVDVERQTKMERISSLENNLHQVLVENDKFTEELELQGEKRDEMEGVLAKGKQAESEVEKMRRMVDRKRAMVETTRSELTGLEQKKEERVRVKEGQEEKMGKIGEEVRREGKMV